MIPLTQAQDISYGIAEAADIDEAADLLANVFSSSEPMAVAVGQSADEVRELVRQIGQRGANQGLTVIARHRPAGELVGVLLTDDFAVPPPGDVRDLPESFRPIAALLDELDQQYRNIHSVVQGQVLHLFMLGIAAEFGGRGIAGALLRLSLENGMRKGYERALTEATGRVSQHVFQRHGFVERFRVPYKDFVYRGRCVFESIGEHEAVILMEKILRA